MQIKLGSQLCIALVASLVFCPLGWSADFGRQSSGIIDQKILPMLGGFAARFRKQPNSQFNLTDDEKLLRAQARHIVAPPHSRDWLHRIATAVQRYKIAEPVDHLLSPDAYYAFLRSDTFRSTFGRYARLQADIAADAVLVPGFFARASQIIATDKLRMDALMRYDGANPNPPVLQRPLIPQTRSMYVAAEARIAENQEVIDWADRAVRFRIESYARAVTRLEIEEPSARASIVKGQIKQLVYVFEKAYLAHVGATEVPVKQVRRSRYMNASTLENFDDPVPQK